MQLLHWLESQLGLELPTSSFTARLVPYLQALSECDNGRFYSQSLAKDKFGVAGTLLRWRDSWYEAGWDGRAFDADASRRLSDMGVVESAAGSRVPCGIGQRVQRVLEALEGTKLDVSVTLLDAPEVFPKVWRTLFVALEAVTDLCTPRPRCQGGSDLARLQRALCGEHESGKVELQGDGSVIVLRDGSPQLSAPWVSRFAHKELAASGDVAVLAGRHGPTLDDALTAAGFPRLGFALDSYWRPPFQVLPLALELIWKPLEPGILLQFLTHPMGPVPRHIRQLLADVVAEQPGIGGDGWIEAVQTALDMTAEEVAADKRAEKRARQAELIDFWLGCERFDPHEGAPLDVLRARVERVSDWLTTAYKARQDEIDAEVYRAAVGQSDELLRTISRLSLGGTNALPRESVRRLVEAIRGTGAPRPGRPWECVAGAVQLLRVDSPAQFLESVDTVIWWGCDEARLPVGYPWSQSELECLAHHGVALTPIDTQLEWQAASWLRPLLAARERLVLVLHDNAESHHPVFDQVMAVATGWAEERIDRLMGDPGRLPLSNDLPATRIIDQQTLPGKTRWWRLGDGGPFARRASESFTSLEKFLYAPHQWVLAYQAQVRPGALSEVADGPMLKGLLTHDLFECFFKAHPDIATINRRGVPAWAEDCLRTLIEQKGAVLLIPGRQSEREYFVDMAVRALGEMISHLQSGNVVSVDMESHIEGKFKGGGLKGSIDLLATNVDGRDAVIDIKWGGLGYRREALEKSNYLQLAVYAQLAHQAKGRWPALGYYIIRDARLLTLDTDYFPQASRIQPENGESHLEFWQRVESTWSWRWEQIERGLIEVPVTATAPDEDSIPGAPGLDMPETFDRFDDYAGLTGWGADA